MAFTDQRKTKHRTATIVAVTALEAAVIYAVVMGLSVTFGPRVVEPPLKTDQFELPPPTPLPTPPAPLPTAQPTESQRDVFRQPLDLGSNDRTLAEPEVTEIPDPQPTQTTIPDPIPSLLPFTPRSAVPRGKPGTWATSDDYPPHDLRAGNQGIAGFRLTIGTNGKVLSCDIVRSSGFPGLDTATCTNVSRRARFEPATDGTGSRVIGHYSNSIRWVIPD